MAHRFGADLVIHVIRGIDQHAVAPARQVERYALVALLRVGTAVPVPDVEVLTVAHQRREMLAQTVDLLAHVQLEAFAEPGFLDVVVGHGAAVEIRDAMRLVIRVGDVSRHAIRPAQQSVFIIKPVS